MKYIKKYEKVPDNGISIDSPYLIKNNNDLPADAKFKLGDYVRLNHKKLVYKLEYYYVHPNEKYECYITIDDCSRMWRYEEDIYKLSDEEVEEYKITKDLTKYNL